MKVNHPITPRANAEAIAFLQACEAILMKEGYLPAFEASHLARLILDCKRGLGNASH